jgi:hypothetical protein
MIINVYGRTNSTGLGMQVFPDTFFTSLQTFLNWKFNFWRYRYKATTANVLHAIEIYVIFAYNF